MATICWLYTDWVEAGGNIMPVITSLTVTTILPTRWPWVCPDFSRNFSLALRSNEVLLLLLKVNSNEPAFNLLMMSVVGLSSITYNSSKEQNQCCCPLPTSCPRRRLKNSKSTSLRRRWTTTDTGATSRSKVNSDVRRHGGRTQWSLSRWVLRDRFGFAVYGAPPTTVHDSTLTRIFTFRWAILLFVNFGEPLTFHSTFAKHRRTKQQKSA